MVENRRSSIIAAAILIIVIGIMGAWVKFLYTPLVTDDQGMKYTVREGMSTRAVIDDLYVLNVVKHPWFFKLLVRMKGVAHQLKAGEYLFPKGSTPPSMLEQISSGSGMVYHSFMIVPGWSFKELRTSLSRDVHFHHVTQTMSDAEIMRQLGHPEMKPEGEFFPDTYFFVEGSDDIVILRRSFKAMQEKLNAAWQHRAPNLPFTTPYQALTGASIIEKEAYIEDELPMIAGVMVNRLRRGMLLQFDPTVIYGMGDNFKGTIRRTDLISKSNPYNTYVRKGLTPTPISMPSLAAIQAIMHPTKHDYYYFVAQSNGSSMFTKHLGDHYAAVAAAKKDRWFFNNALARYYLMKLFSQRIYNF